jgi:Bacteriophage head to tail connecting protein
MDEKNKALGSALRDRWSALKGERAPWESMWRELADYTMPRKTGSTDMISSPSSNREARLFDTTQIDANATLANGQLSWMTPQATPWFSYEPSAQLEKSDEAKLWLGSCSESARKELKTSNFYTAIHEFYMDRSCFGTAAIYCEKSKRGKLNFRNLPCGSYCIAEDDEGNVDTVFWETEMTARQMFQRFGEQCSEAVRKQAENASSANSKHKVIHAVYPREDHERDTKQRDKANMPIASVFFEEANGIILEVGGYWSMPVMVSRYLVWHNGLGGVYGWSPAWAALPDARQLNHLQMMMDALAEKAAFPPVAAPASFDGEIDLSAGAVNYYNDDKANTVPISAIGVVGNYNVGLQRIQEKQASIRRHFHADLFEMFGNIEKQMTAAEVNARLREKVIQISPSFARLTTELLNPLLERVFQICVELGIFSPPPASAIMPISETEGQLVMPIAAYTSRMEIELRSLVDTSFERTIQKVMATAQFRPNVVDNIDWDALVRANALGDGMDAEMLFPMQKVNDLRQQAAQAAQAQIQMEQAAGAAKMAGDLGRIRNDSPVGQAAKDIMTNL